MCNAILRLQKFSDCAKHNNTIYFSILSYEDTALSCKCPSRAKCPPHNSDSFVVFQGSQCNYPHAIFLHGDSQFLLTHNSYWLTIHIATEFTNSCDHFDEVQEPLIRQQGLDTSVIASSATFFNSSDELCGAFPTRLQVSSTIQLSTLLH